MIKKTVIAVAVSAIACAAWTSSASAKHHVKHKMAAPAAQAQAMPGVNPMTNAPATPAVANPQPFAHQPGVNPM